MVLGIGTGTPVGIAGGLFHMLNNAIYKSCLFFAAGAVEKRAGTTDLARLGGFSKTMPISFVTFLIGSMAISGVPPFNGFASKWMVYQGIIEAGEKGGPGWVIWLVAAMFGSALTLASFMKLVHSVFLGQPAKETPEQARRAGEVGPAMWLPTVFLAGLCIVFGVFAYSVPLKSFILPGLNLGVQFPGMWHPVVATALILIGLAAGALIYFLGTASKLRTVAPFVGGETLDEHTAMRVSGVDFYKTIQDVPLIRFIYQLAERKVFDVYDVGRWFTLGFSRVLGFLHNGVLSRYLAWCAIAMAVLFYILAR
jgi:NADH:ubiquinone oxidoreductase subunit 5 (subunit L)/multisubunit Na+/H+ antiporter MnhA subunit